MAILTCKETAAAYTISRMQALYASASPPSHTRFDFDTKKDIIMVDLVTNIDMTIITTNGQLDTYNNIRNIGLYADSMKIPEGWLLIIATSASFARNPNRYKLYGYSLAIQWVLVRTTMSSSPALRNGIGTVVHLQRLHFIVCFGIKICVISGGSRIHGKSFSVSLVQIDLVLRSG
jgi:hypothetical protein